MGKENIILIGTNSSQKLLRERSSNFLGRNLIEQLPSSTFTWGRVLSVNTSTKSIIYSLIDDVVGYVKTGNAIPININNITLPTIGNIVPLSKGPDTNVSNNAGQYSKTIYYGDPIGVQQTVNGNTVDKNKDNKITIDLNKIDFPNGSSGVKKTNANIKITSPSSADIDFYKAILAGIGAPTSNENLKLSYAWRQAEGGSAAWNPFNTTFVKAGVTNNNCNKNANGTLNAVKNYASKQDGIDATVSTLKLSYYTKIRTGLINDIGAEIISSYIDELSIWGTGIGINNVLAGPLLNPPPISQTTVKIATC